jgi:hypothetical protein
MKLLTPTDIEDYISELQIRLIITRYSHSLYFDKPWNNVDTGVTTPVFIKIHQQIASPVIYQVTYGKYTTDQ